MGSGNNPNSMETCSYGKHLPRNGRPGKTPIKTICRNCRVTFCIDSRHPGLSDSYVTGSVYTVILGLDVGDVVSQDPRFGCGDIVSRVSRVPKKLLTIEEIKNGDNSQFIRGVWVGYPSG